MAETWNNRGRCSHQIRITKIRWTLIHGDMTERFRILLDLLTGVVVTFTSSLPSYLTDEQQEFRMVFHHHREMIKASITEINLNTTYKQFFFWLYKGIRSFLPWLILAWHPKWGFELFTYTMKGNHNGLPSPWPILKFDQ